MTATSALFGGIALVGGSCAVVGAVAVVSSPFNRRRDARAQAAASVAADRIAASIAAGEQDARDAVDRLALAAGCARILRHLIPAEPPAIDWWQRGLDGIDAATIAVPVPDYRDELRLAACLQYCTDLAYDGLRAEGRNLEANRISTAMGAFLMSRLLERVEGWRHLETHREAGVYAMSGNTSDPAPACPFCGFGVYDQTTMRCPSCATDGGLTRTVPAVLLPRRTAPDPRLSALRVADIEKRAEANLYSKNGSI